MEMNLLLKKECYSIADIAKLLDTTNRAIYMHYYRGHLKPIKSMSHKVYFAKAEVVKFINDYYSYML